MDADVEIELRARLLALQHAIVVLYSQRMFDVAEASGVSSMPVARDLADGLPGTVAEGQFPAEVRAGMMRTLREIGQQVILNVQTYDALKGGGV